MLLKQESVALKGVAILIMLFLHLFDQPYDGGLYTYLLQIQREPLVFQLSKFAGICVPLYLFLSGYGLYITSQKSENMHNKRRVFSLYVNFWIVFVLFIGLASILKPNVYPGTLSAFIANFTGWHTTYNGEWWFLFPYMLLALSSRKIMHAVYRMHYLALILLLGSMYLGTFVLIKLNGSYLYSHQLVYMPILYLNCLFSFGMGAIFAKEDWFGRFKTGIGTWRFLNVWLILGILVLVVVRMLLPVSVFNPIFACLFLLLFATLNRTKWLDLFLSKMGEQSTNMWLIHTFFCYYLFRDFIYGFKYPLVIYIVLLLVSYFSALVVDRINQPLQKMIKERF